MMGKKDLIMRDQYMFTTLDRLVPADHLVRKMDSAVDLSFIYELVQDLYSETGKESIDPVVLIKITLIQYTFGIRSMRQTIREIETNVAYRWYLGYGFEEEIPHFSTFGKNYTRRFAGTDLFEQIFEKILSEIEEQGCLHAENIFLDGTHIKASANNHNSRRERIPASVRFYEEELQKEIDADRISRGKAACKKKQKKSRKQKRSKLVPSIQIVVSSTKGSIKWSLLTQRVFSVKRITIF